MQLHWKQCLILLPLKLESPKLSFLCPGILSWFKAIASWKKKHKQFKTRAQREVSCHMNSHESQKTVSHSHLYFPLIPLQQSPWTCISTTAADFISCFWCYDHPQTFPFSICFWIQSLHPQPSPTVQHLKSPRMAKSILFPVTFNLPPVFLQRV